MRRKFIHQILEDINNDTSLLNGIYMEDPFVRTILKNAFNKKLRWLLPEGNPDVPSFKPNGAKIGTAPLPFYQLVNKFSIFYRTDIRPEKMEKIYINTYRELAAEDGEIFLLLKEQTLTDKYPNITPDFIVESGLVSSDDIINAETTKPVEEIKEEVIEGSDIFEASNEKELEVKKPKKAPKKVNKKSTKKNKDS